MSRSYTVLIGLLSAASLASAHGLHSGEAATHSGHGLLPIIAVIGGAAALILALRALLSRAN